MRPVNWCGLPTALAPLCPQSICSTADRSKIDSAKDETATGFADWDQRAAPLRYVLINLLNHAVTYSEDRLVLAPERRSQRRSVAQLDVILMNIQMPGMDGFEAMKQNRARSHFSRCANHYLNCTEEYYSTTISCPEQQAMNRSILVIDDEPDNFDVISTLLSQQNYKLHYAASGQKAIDSLEIYQPDLILLDVMMPGVDGIQVCRQIKAMSKCQTIPIIVVTALDSKSDLARCLNAGADDFISKPINALELRSRVHSMLRIKQQYDNLQSLLKLREDMVQMLIHDLRNPLTGILLNLELLRAPDYPKEKHPHKLAQLHKQALILERLIEDLLSIALIESKQINLNLTRVNIGNLIQDAIAQFKIIAAQKNIDILVKITPDNHSQIFVDAPLFQRVIDNLLANAIKFSPRRSQIIINVELLDANIKIQVIDSGPGVPDALQKTIFKKYEIGTRMPDVSQIGLGLAFCKMVVEAHQGQIQVMNNLPKGSIFEITLPCAETGAISAD